MYGRGSSNFVGFSRVSQTGRYGHTRAATGAVGTHQAARRPLHGPARSGSGPWRPETRGGEAEKRRLPRTLCLLAFVGSLMGDQWPPAGVAGRPDRPTAGTDHRAGAGRRLMCTSGARYRSMIDYSPTQLERSGKHDGAATGQVAPSRPELAPLSPHYDVRGRLCAAL